MIDFLNLVLIGLIFDVIVVVILVFEVFLRFLYLGMYVFNIFGLLSFVYMVLCGVGM